jgi:uncharacterized protein (DUF2384 family)
VKASYFIILHSIIAPQRYLSPPDIIHKVPKRPTVLGLPARRAGLLSWREVSVRGHRGESGGHRSEREDALLVLSAFRKVAKAVGLPIAAQADLLGVSRSKFSTLARSPEADADKLDKMVLFVEIYELAAQGFPGQQGASGWLRRPNLAPIFGGEAPLKTLLEGRFVGLLRTRDHLQWLVRVW